MKFKSGVLAIFMVTAVAVGAQRGEELKQYFEGRQVRLKIDMPATKDGVNLYPDRAQPLNYTEYGNRIKRKGTSIRVGDSVMVTAIKVTGNHIEFQLAGGGYGTFFDESDAPTHVPSVEKSRREKDLDRRIEAATDERERSRLRRERDDLREWRRREDQRNQERARAEGELRKGRVEQKALQGGSRFNIYFVPDRASEALTREWVMKALEKYVDFE